MFRTLIFIVFIAGLVGLWYAHPELFPFAPTGGPVSTQFSVTSSAFKQDTHIPPQYTCDGINVNPPLAIKNIPDGTKSLALIVEDLDASGWNHWLVWDIDPSVTTIREAALPKGGVEGTNDFSKTEYSGPCPPTSSHRYVFHVYALDTILNLPQGAGRRDLENAMRRHIVDKTEIIGKYGSG